MKVNKLMAAMGVAAVAAGIAACTAGLASAVSNVKPFGQQEILNDYGSGAPMIGYTVGDLTPSSDPVPHNGQLYEATLTVDSMGGWVTPIIPMFNARSESGSNYRLVADTGFGSVPPGGNASGKLYFDVVGDQPNSVVYNDGFQDLLAWVPGPHEGGTRP